MNNDEIPLETESSDESDEVTETIENTELPTEEISKEDSKTEEIVKEEEFKLRPKLDDNPKQKLINQIFAAGINTYERGYTPIEQEIMKKFLELEFDLIAPTWSFLNPQVQFKIFSQHITDFQNYMINRDKEKK
jgi:hypothetical protein